MVSEDIDALRRVACFDAFLAKRTDHMNADDSGKGGKGGDSGVSEECRLPKRAPSDAVSPRNIPWPMSFSSDKTVDLGDFWLGDAQVPVDGSDESCKQAYQHAQFTDGRLNENLASCSMQLDDNATISRSKTTALADEDNVYIGCLSSRGSFIIEGRHGPVIAQKPYPSMKKSSNTRWRKRRFQRFVASKQNHRTDTEIHSSPSRRPMTQESSTTSLVRESPTSFAEPPKSVEHSPTGVIEFPSENLSTCDPDYDEVPAMVDQTVAKQVFNFIRVEKHCNLKGIMQQTASNHRERKSKSLTWWDDKANMYKPFTLKTDESFDWDDDASYTYFPKSGWWNDQFQDFCAGNMKRAMSFDDSVAHDAHPNDASSDSVNIGDELRRKIIGGSLEYYREKLEKSISQVYEAGIQLKLEEIFDSATKSIAEDERVASLLKLAPFSCNGI